MKKAPVSKCKKDLNPCPTAEGWQLSNAQVFPMAIHNASLEIFDRAGMSNLRAKSELLTAYLEFLLNEANTKNEFEIITPKNKNERGCQLSLLFKRNGKATFDRLLKHHIIADWREPNVLRMSPVPLYNSFEEMWLTAQALVSEV